MKKKNVEKVDLFVEVVKSKEENNTIEEEKSEVIKKKKINYCICDLCGKDIYSSPININLNMITGKANWHRNCKIDKLSICNDCATELNTLIDKFIINKNNDLIKFKVENENKEEENKNNEDEEN